MAKVIAAFNMTLDGVCDHTVGTADGELHQHYTDLLADAEIILYGRVTYQLMQYWQDFTPEKSPEVSHRYFAEKINALPKLVFSHTLKDSGWESAEIARRPLAEELAELKKRKGKNILVGSRSLIIQLLNHGFIEELQLCLHPVLQGGGMMLFINITKKIPLKLLKVKTLKSGGVILYYKPEANCG